MTLFRKLVLGLGLLTGWLVSGSVLALQQCGSSNCKVISVYRNDCVAIVVGDLSEGHVIVLGSSENLQGDKSKAMQSCLSQQ